MRTRKVIFLSLMGIYFIVSVGVAIEMDFDCGSKSVSAEVFDLCNFPSVFVVCVDVMSSFEVFVEVVVLQFGSILTKHLIEL